jgi:hypothetical protein
MMMEAANTSETLVNCYQTSQGKNPEDSHLHSRRRENLKSHNQTIIHVGNEIALSPFFCFGRKTNPKFISAAHVSSCEGRDNGNVSEH